MNYRKIFPVIFSIIFIIIVLVMIGCNGCGGGGGGAGDSAAGSGGTIALAWDSNTETDLDGYKIYYGTASGAYNAPGSPKDAGMATQLSPTQTTYTLTGLVKGQHYYICVTAYNKSGYESGPSNIVDGDAK